MPPVHFRTSEMSSFFGELIDIDIVCQSGGAYSFSYFFRHLLTYIGIFNSVARRCPRFLLIFLSRYTTYDKSKDQRPLSHIGKNYEEERC